MDMVKEFALENATFKKSPNVSNMPKIFEGRLPILPIPS